MDGVGDDLPAVEAVGRMKGGVPTFQAPFSPAAYLKGRTVPKKTRKPISKKVRFGVFKRDEFTCQYCGRTPPAVVLEVDHILAVSKGGDNAEHNLLTACFDCNNGKGPGTIKAPMVDLTDRMRVLKEKTAQALAYNKMLLKERMAAEDATQRIADIYAEGFDGWKLTTSARTSIVRFLGKLPEVRVAESMELAVSRMEAKHAFRYFCGVCWRMIKDD